MKTVCDSDGIRFEYSVKREVIGKSDGGMMTSDAGGIISREVGDKTGIIKDFASCFTDHRDPKRTDHTVGQPIYLSVYTDRPAYAKI